MVLFIPISPVSPLLLTILLSSFARSVSSSSNQSYGSTSHISSWSKAHRPGVANITNKETESQNPCQSADIHQEDNWVIHKKRHKNKRSLSFTTSYPHSQLHHSGKEENVISNKPEREREKKKKRPGKEIYKGWTYSGFNITTIEGQFKTLQNFLCNLLLPC